MTLYLDKFFHEIPYLNDLNTLTTLEYLVLVFIITALITTALIILPAKERGKESQGKPWHQYILLIPITLLIVSLAEFPYRFTYPTIYIMAYPVLAITIATIIIKKVDGRISRTLLLITTVLLVTSLASQAIVNGIEEQETTSDTINIYIKGYFRYSLHASWYNLMPFDSTMQVIMLRVLGIHDIFNPYTATAMFTVAGLLATLLIYALLKNKKEKEAVYLTPFVIMLFPYSLGPVLSTPPDNIALAFDYAFIAYTLIRLEEGGLNRSDAVILILIGTAAILAHPYGLVTAIFLMIIIISIYITKQKHTMNISGKTTTSILTTLLVVILIIWFSKMIYTWLQGAAGWINTFINSIIEALTIHEPLTVITTRNLGYSAIPRISITGFAVLPAVASVYTLLILIRGIVNRRLNMQDVLLVLTMAVYVALVLVTYATARAYVSQSRTLIPFAEPILDMVFVWHLTTEGRKILGARHARIAALLALLTIMVFITPNTLPNNYTIGTSKSATYNDHIIAYQFMGMISKTLIINSYQECKTTGLVMEEVQGAPAYGMGSTMAGVYYFIVPGIVNAKSYWDPCFMALWSIPKNTSNYAENIIYSAWVYRVKLYTYS